ncbi:MAG TPA: type IV pilus assembly protein PilM [Pirellulales bacterium]|jgi:type IV pilus assembly protein PilM
MAKSSAVWGIDIGQCAVKALRCRPGDDDSQVLADAFDYIEYPKILSQPDADPAELVREALELFLSRNTVRGDKVAISVSGQSGLARFIKLPPVESKKIPDIVKYEARQQIPFALEDVVWDYQQMPGGSEEDGFALETEVGLFAMKRDQVERALKPFEEAGIEVDVVQLTPLTIYNYTVFDQMQDLPPADQYDPDNPPESVVVLSLGTDTTDLVITNGYRVWQRSVPLGGSHFTKALTKELRLTFAKAEHLKKNAAKAEDPKAVFQAMRPVFNDLLTQIQRSIGYFTSIDRGAKIGRVIALGNAMKLPGLQKYLSQNLGFPVGEVKNYRGVTGDTVVTAPAFKENLLSFAVCYGLVLQGMGHAKLATNLLPPEIVTDRMIREKKPWAVALVAMLLLGCAASFFGHWRAWNSVDLKKFDSALNQAKSAEGIASTGKSAYETALNDFKSTSQIGEGLVGNVDGRLLWLEMMTTLSQCLPKDETRPEDIMDRNEVHISELQCEWQADLATWYQAGVADKVKEMQASMMPASAPAGATPAAPADVAPAADGAAPVAPDAAPAGAAPADAPAADPAATAAATPPPEDTGPKGPGWVIQLRGEHYHNKQSEGGAYVRDTLVKNLREKEIVLPGKDGKPEKMPLKELGIGYPVIVETSGKILDETLTDAERNTTSVRKFTFVVQFAWSPTPISKRIEARQQKASGQAPALADSPAGGP